MTRRGLHRTWVALAWLGVSLTVALSLAPMPDTGLHVEQGDKLGHLLAYGVLTFWCAQLARTRRTLLLQAVAICALGISMEVLQSLTSWRMGNDPWDALANTIGISIGAALGATSLGRVLARWETRLAA